MQLEFRADGAHISGYVNVTEKKSRPVMTPHGRVVEEIEPRAFETAIQRAGNITLTVDHDDSHIYADTKNGTLKLYEDNIGLHADVLIADPDLIEIAKKGRIRAGVLACTMCRTRWNSGRTNCPCGALPRWTWTM